jgi:hypothetical protein
MKSPRYKRSKGQVLHRFEPGAVVTIPVGTVEIYKHFARKDTGRSRDLEDAVRQELLRWRHYDAQMQAFIDHKADFVPVDITSVSGKRLVVRECSRCNAVRNTDMAEWKNAIDAPCHQCGHLTLNEVPFVFAHTDGTMVQLSPEPCPQHGYDYLVLERGARKRWRCKISGCNHTKQIMRPLPKTSIMKRKEVIKAVNDATGNPPKSHMSLTTVSDNKLQVVHSISRIDPTPHTDIFQTVDRNLEAILSIHLGYLKWHDKNLVNLTEALRAVGKGTQEDQRGMDTIQKILANQQGIQERDAGGPVVAELRRALGHINETTLRILGDAKAEREARDRGDALTSRQESARSLREQLVGRAVLFDLKQEHIENAMARLSEMNSPFHDNLSKAWKILRERLGITGVEVIQDLPVLHLAYGYTRLSHEPEAAVLWAFERKKFDLAGDEPSGNWVPMPVYKLSTEALSFQFDAARIVRWLHANNLAPDPASITEPTLWLLERYRPVNSRSGPAFSDTLPIEFLIPWLVGSALHSATHLLIRAIADQSSFGETALSEHLLLGLNQTIIFVNRLQEFSLGGLKTFFEQRLDQALNTLLEERSDCMFDPYCHETLGGACAGCLQLPEVVCRLFNNALSRTLLYGGDISEAEGEGGERTLWREPNLFSLIRSNEFIGLWDKRLDSPIT